LRQMSRVSHLSTFSIVAHDPSAAEWGVAVASKFLAVGAVVPWARAGVGAVATQAYANTSFGPAGLELMDRGHSAQDTLDRLLARDEDQAQRQIGAVDSAGRAASFTGEACYSWAGGRTGSHYAVQGNILAGSQVIGAMADTFERTVGLLVNRLLAALGAGQEAGGDSRGRQSAAILVVREKGGYAGFNDRLVDLRVDDNPEPIGELGRLLEMHKLYMFPTRPEDVLPIDQTRAQFIQQILRHSTEWGGPADGLYSVETQEAFRALCGSENLENRWREGPEVDRIVLEYLGGKYGVSPG
jgi:uncharacterized Ntn-hydrolase superfamily protein